jgi:hypothetical protein
MNNVATGLKEMCHEDRAGMGLVEYYFQLQTFVPAVLEFYFSVIRE